MKVMLINGSPHEKGCTYTALMECAKTLNEGGIETEAFWIGKKPVQGCVACGGCARLGRCAFNDLVNTFVEKAQTADGFIFGSPVYFSGMNGSLMSFMDRAFFAGPRNKAGNPFAYKPAAAVVSARRAGTTSALDQMNMGKQVQLGQTGMKVYTVGLGCMGFSHASGAPTDHGTAVRTIHEAYEMVMISLIRRNAIPVSVRMAWSPITRNWWAKR